MIAHLNGRLIEKSPTYIIVECGGVGYFVKISLNTFSKIGTLKKKTSCCEKLYKKSFIELLIQRNIEVKKGTSEKTHYIEEKNLYRTTLYREFTVFQ